MIGELQQFICRKCHKTFWVKPGTLECPECRRDDYDN